MVRTAARDDVRLRRAARRDATAAAALRPVIARSPIPKKRPVGRVVATRAERRAADWDGWAFRAGRRLDPERYRHEGRDPEGGPVVARVIPSRGARRLAARLAVQVGVEQPKRAAAGGLDVFGDGGPVHPCWGRGRLEESRRGVLAVIRRRVRAVRADRSEGERFDDDAARRGPGRVGGRWSLAEQAAYSDPFYRGMRAELQRAAEEGAPVFCGLAGPGCRKAATIPHHIRPIRRGGDSSPGNLMPSCSWCNNWQGRVGRLGGVQQGRGRVGRQVANGAARRVGGVGRGRRVDRWGRLLGLR